MKRILLILAAAFVVLYLAPVAFGSTLQDRFIYFPSTDVVDPTGDIELVLIETADGEKLRAWGRPADAGKPTFLYLGGNAGRPELETGRWRRIAESGAGFLAPSYRGYSGSTGTPSEAGLHLDAAAAYERLIADGVAPEDIVIHGFSLGSAVATKLAMERDARALILEAPLTSVADVAWRRAPFIPYGLFLRSRFPSREWIKTVDEPILIVHGDADRVIPFEQGERMARLATAPATFVAMPGSDHATLVRDGLYDHVWAFLAGLEG
jgi:hypothetical protein